MTSDDTIASVSSATGPAARMIVRLSGPRAWTVASQLCPELPPEGNAASRKRVDFSGLSVPAWVYVFRAPRSYTGEDLIEFHIPGNPILAKMLLAELFRSGARPAEAGEFTARAYFNARLDLTEAEGVAATIAAGNEAELSAARQLLAGELARRLRPATDMVAETLALVEVGIDFSDEDVSFLSADEVGRRVGAAEAMLHALLADSSRFERLAHEPHLVLVGRPNAGKSTLLNALAGQARAVTSPAAGTTRDALTAEVALPRGTVRLTDVAGLEEADLTDPGEEAGFGSEGPGATGREMDPPSNSLQASDPRADIDRRMRRQALRALESADAAVLVHDATDPRPPLRLPRPPGLTVFSKSDLLPADRGPQWQKAPGEAPPPSDLFVSAHTGRQLDSLRRAMDRLAFGAAVSGSCLALNARHVRAIEQGLQALARSTDVAPSGSPELLALELREALDALGQVLGQVSPDDLLGRIFSSFCIGK